MCTVITASAFSVDVQRKLDEGTNNCYLCAYSYLLIYFYSIGNKEKNVNSTVDNRVYKCHRHIIYF